MEMPIIVRTDMALEFDCHAVVEYNVFEKMGVSSGLWDRSTYRYNLVFNNMDRGFLIRSDAIVKSGLVPGRFTLV